MNERQTKLLDGLFGEVIHTAARKYMDSDWSTAFWHSVHIIPNEVWSHFCTHCIDHLKGLDLDQITIKDWKVMFRKWTVGKRWEVHGLPVVKDAHWSEHMGSKVNIFQALFGMIDDDDLSGFHYSLIGVIKDAEKYQLEQEAEENTEKAA